MKLVNPDFDFARANVVRDGELVLVATPKQLRLFAASILQSMESVEDWGFHTLLGVQPAELDALGSELRALLRVGPRPSETGLSPE